MRVVAFDTETRLIGPDEVPPKLICFSAAWRDDSGEIVKVLTGNGDDCIEDDLADLFQPGHMLVGLNIGGFDLGVVANSYPALVPLIWAKIKAGEVDDVGIREKLLNLSSVGHLDTVTMPDGTTRRISYSLAALVLERLGIDLKDEKDDPNSPRYNYWTQDGVPAADYPSNYSAYALDDAEYPLLVYEDQDRDIETEDGYASCATSPFHTAADFALFCITQEGMCTDPEEVDKLRAWLAEELSPEKHRPLYEAGILVPPVPPRPNASQGKRAAVVVREMGGEIHEVEHETAKGKKKIRYECDDWGPYLEAIEASGVKISAPQKEKRSDLALRPYVQKVAERVGYQLKLTPTEQISTDSETMGDLAPFDPLLKIYGHRAGLQKLVTTDIPRMEWQGELADVVRFPFNVLVRTTRTSSRTNDKYPSGNGQQVHPKVRPCFKARPGHVLCSVDYSSLELVCVAEITYKLFGEKSVHWQKVNAGYNMHAFLGAQLAAYLDPSFAEWCESMGVNLLEFDDVYGAFMLLEHENPKYFKHFRGLAKPTGLGFPGGLGPKTMLGFAKNSYGVNFITIAEDRAEEFPEEFEEPRRSTLYYAQDLYDMAPSEFEWNPTLRGIQLAAMIRDDVWHTTYPEMRAYFDYVSKDCSDVQNPTIGYSDDGDREVRGLCYTSPLGMHRAACSFTACANGQAMQTPGAEGAKEAVINVVRATLDPSLGSILYGCKVVNFVHDELILDLIDDGPDSLHDRACEVQRIMEDSLSSVIKHTKVGTEAALMERWDKRASPVFDDHGRLAIWRP